MEYLYTETYGKVLNLTATVSEIIPQVPHRSDQNAMHAPVHRCSSVNMCCTSLEEVVKARRLAKLTPQHLILHQIF